MTTRRKRSMDVLSVGELLIDFISTEFTDQLRDATHYKRLQGGSAANLCLNMARLGNRTQMVASIGADAMGDFLIEQLKSLAVGCSSVRQIAQPTTLILVSRSREISTFQAYRSADCQITESQILAQNLNNYSIFHTTCFALSAMPAQEAIMKSARSFMQKGGQLSIDLNYAEKIWPDRIEAQRLIEKYCSYGALVKVSEVDWRRIWPERDWAPEEICRFYRKLGAREVCLTLGAEGCYVAHGDEIVYLPARSIEVKGTTGAGDAFWSGYLTVWLDGWVPLHCAMAGRRMAELKLGSFGPLPDQMRREEIYADISKQG